MSGVTDLKRRFLDNIQVEKQKRYVTVLHEIFKFVKANVVRIIKDFPNVFIS